MPTWLWLWFYHACLQRLRHVCLVARGLQGTVGQKYKAGLRSACIPLHQCHVSWHCRQSRDLGVVEGGYGHSLALR